MTIAVGIISACTAVLLPIASPTMIRDILPADPTFGKSG